MKSRKSFFGLLTLSGIMVLSACGENTMGRKMENSKSSVAKPAVSTSNINSKGSTDKKNKKEKQITKSSSDNQLDLKIGDTGTVKSNISKYEITLNGVQMKKGAIDGEQPQLDLYILAEITIKNVGKSKLDAKEVARDLNLEIPKTGGESDNYAGEIKVVHPLKGGIKPGGILKGQALFDIYNAKKYRLIDGKGLADKGAGLQNKIVWTFKASEAK